MSAIDPQKALCDAMAFVLRESLTEPMSIEDLCRIFGVGYRVMKSHLASIETLRAGTMYRVPVRLMPSHWLAETLPILAESCVKPHIDRHSV